MPGALDASRALPPPMLTLRQATTSYAGIQATRRVSRPETERERGREWAMRWGFVPRNVAELVDPPRPKRYDITVLTPEQARAVLAAASGDRLEALYVPAITTGMRQGKLLALRWRDVDLDGARLQVRSTLYRVTTGPATKGMADKGLTLGSLKTHKGRRQMALTSDAVAPLRRRRIRQLEERLAVGEARNHQDLVFPSHVGRPIETTNLIKRSYKLLLEKAGRPNIRFHNLRHTAATLFLRKKVPAKVVSEMLGFSQVAITLKIYSHVLPAMQREATAAMEAATSG